MKRSRATWAFLISVAAPGLASLTVPAVARDSLPESLRLEEQAKKDYEQQPVVPIERGNAHHRDVGGSGGDVLPSDPALTPSTPSTTPPPPPANSAPK
jgi:hypothetical protein